VAVRLPPGWLLAADAAITHATTHTTAACCYTTTRLRRGLDYNVPSAAARHTARGDACTHICARSNLRRWHTGCLRWTVTATLLLPSAHHLFIPPSTVSLRCGTRARFYAYMPVPACRLPSVSPFYFLLPAARTRVAAVRRVVTWRVGVAADELHRVAARGVRLFAMLPPKRRTFLATVYAAPAGGCTPLRILRCWCGISDGRRFVAADGFWFGTRDGSWTRDAVSLLFYPFLTTRFPSLPPTSSPYHNPAPLLHHLPVYSSRVRLFFLYVRLVSSATGRGGATTTGVFSAMVVFSANHLLTLYWFHERGFFERVPFTGCVIKRCAGYTGNTNAQRFTVAKRLPSRLCLSTSYKTVGGLLGRSIHR